MGIPREEESCRMRGRGLTSSSLRCISAILPIFAALVLACDRSSGRQASLQGESKEDSRMQKVNSCTHIGCTYT